MGCANIALSDTPLYAGFIFYIEQNHSDITPHQYVILDSKQAFPNKETWRVNTVLSASSVMFYLCIKQHFTVYTHIVSAVLLPLLPQVEQQRPLILPL